ncbi:beta-glucosidase [Nocardia pseudobrasiliensis]|uniref:Beta-glucosidase n=1 Tax=Nocardia pseudobrasiliensis TaxID=45979 RepID=A0A370I804_9NOCA|nr:beta-glucosidase [Nocardia pseudobrasiliensis]
MSRRPATTLARALLAAIVIGVSASAVPAQAASEPPGRVDPLPADFLWGVATSGFQSEGHAPASNWTGYIDNPAFGHEKLRDSVDFYTHYREDIARAADLGVKVFRLSVEWARVQPQPGRWDEAGFQFYERVLAQITAAGMQPMITLDHWVYPAWLGPNGWEDPGMVDKWLTNARKVVDRFDSPKTLWVTINEPVAYIVQELNHHPGPDFDGRFHKMEDSFAQAHNGIYDYIHGKRPDAMVTSNIGFVSRDDESVNGRIFGLIRDKLDFVSVDYYFGATVDLATRRGPRLGATADGSQLWNMPLQAEGIYYVIRRYVTKIVGNNATPEQKRKVKIYVAENGMATKDGCEDPTYYRRADYLRDVTYWLQRARMDDFNVIGYNYWSLTDNYEWGSYTPRFGLYTVDVTTDPALTRKPTCAVDAYRTVIRDGGVPPDYLPTRAPVVPSLVDPPSSVTDPVTLPPRSG